MEDLSPQISVAIVNWNTRDLLLACLRAVAASRGASAECIVVDNASTDGSADAVAREFPDAVLIRNPDNRGFAAATNQALARARGKYWALLNPDAAPEPNALAILARVLDLSPEIWAAGPQLLNADGSLQASGRRFPSLRREGLAGFLPERVKRGDAWLRYVYGRSDFSAPAWVEEVSGACFLARRDAFDRVGLFDERFFLFYEEVDWFRRVAAAGGRVRYVPEARVTHVWGAGMSQNPGGSTEANLRSRFYYWRKHRGPVGEIAARAWVCAQALAGMAGRAVLTLAGRRPYRELAPRLRLQARLLGLALGIAGSGAPRS